MFFIEHEKKLAYKLVVVVSGRLAVSLIIIYILLGLIALLYHQLSVLFSAFVNRFSPPMPCYYRGGKNLRTRHQPQLNARQKSEASFDASSNIQHCSSSHSNSASPKPHKKKKLVPIHVVSCFICWKRERDIICNCSILIHILLNVTSQAEPIPTLQSITNFVAKLCNDTQTEYECIVISLIYVRRLIKNSNGELVLSKENWKGIIMSCIVLSNKVWDDFHMQNLDYCYVFNGLTLQRVNSLELQLLISMDTRCNVSPSVYAQTHFEIQAMITLTNIEKGKPKKIKNRFSAKFARVHPDENVDGAQKQIETVNMTNVEHPSPYRKFFDFDSLDKKTENTEGEENNSENSAHLSVDEYATFDTSAGLKIPAPAFSEGNDPEVEEPVGRKKLIHSVDLEKQKRHLRVLIQYDESSLITEPSVKTNNGSSKTGETNGSNTSMLSRGNSFKLAKQHSRKSFHGGGAFTALSPLAPIMSAKVTVSRAWWHCLPFSLCMGKVQDVVI